MINTILFHQKKKKIANKICKMQHLTNVNTRRNSGKETSIFLSMGI